jgi:hypothetical protein
MGREVTSHPHFDLVSRRSSAGHGAGSHKGSCAQQYLIHSPPLFLIPTHVLMRLTIVSESVVTTRSLRSKILICLTTARGNNANLACNGVETLLNGAASGAS